MSLVKKDSSSPKRILIVGVSGGTHLGDAFLSAAQSLGLEAKHLDSNLAFRAWAPVKKFYWRVFKRRPVHLDAFSRQVEATAKAWRPDWILSTGQAPISRKSLDRILKMNSPVLNYLTDDPWSPAHHAPWFLQALPLYTRVFTPRKSNMDDLKGIGCLQVQYLPFAYSPELFFKERTATAEELRAHASDIVFVGGGDRDRLPYMTALIKAGFNLALYGGFWDKWKETRSYYRGHANPRTLRIAIGASKIGLCLVRKLNRDGNSMRTFEVPAIGTCMLTEDTLEHREIFGEEGQAVLYFKSPEELISKTTYLLENEIERQRLADRVHHLIVEGKNTYQDRLQTILHIVSSREML